MVIDQGIQRSRDALAMAKERLRAGDHPESVEDQVWMWLVTVHNYAHADADKYASDATIEAMRQLAQESAA